MAPILYVRYARVAVAALAFLFHCIPSIGIAEKIAVRCWRCGNVFAMPEHAASNDCPACRTACRLSRDTGSLSLYCVDSGSESCAFILRCPDRSTVVFTGPDGANGRRIAGYLRKIGTEEIAVLIGAQGTRACMQSLVEIMKQFRVVQFFDPGFKGGGKAYADYLDTLRSNEVNYRVVRAMESIQFGTVKFYVMRPSSLGADGAGGNCLSLCAVHGGNSFLLSGGLRGQTATFQQLPELSTSQIPRMLFQGASAPLKAVSSSPRRGGMIILESDGREIGVRSLQQISVAPSHVGTQSAASQKASTAACAQKGRININTATAPQLDEMNGIGPKKAATIIEFRKAHGPFRTIEDIQKVPGIGEKLFERNRERMCVR
jgi:competence ComEA-like helix-hairpin-helix protein